MESNWRFNVWKTGATGLGMALSAREVGLQFNYVGWFPQGAGAGSVRFYTAVPGQVLNFYRTDAKLPGYRFPHGYTGLVPDDVE